MKRLTIPSAVLSLFFTCFASIGVFASPVNINNADAKTMSAALNGIGPKIASAIIEYRKIHGDFDSPADLLKVKGVGPKILERNKGDILTENVSSKTSAD